jgi:threonyl-tRNA synthetase
LSVTNLILEIYKDLGFENVLLQFSDRPKKRVGDDKIWDKAETALLKAIKQSKLKCEINKGEGAFYGPKIDFVLRDAIGRDWQCGTLQVDLNLPSRLGSSYVARDGSKKVPVMLHRALFGSLERFIGILIEHYAGKLPLWLAPLQVVVLPISSEFDNYAKNIFEQCIKVGINTEVDLKNQKINYKIREHSLSKVPLLLICGQKEFNDKTVTIRRLGSEKQETLLLDQAIKQISQKNKFPIN